MLFFPHSVGGANGLWAMRASLVSLRTDGASDDEQPIRVDKSPGSSNLATDQDIQSPDIWFSDGNIVIVVIETDENARRRHLYKVHKSILSMHSPVWRDMFGLPQSFNSPASGDCYNGVPVVILPDDVKDVDDLLSAIYKPTEFQMKPLRDDWPLTLQQWDSNEAYMTVLMGGTRIDEVRDLYPDPGDVIQLAKQFGLEDILPPAFYHASRTLWPLDSFSSSGRKVIAERMCTASESLTKIDLVTILCGREAVRMEIMRFFRHLKSIGVSNDCQNGGKNSSQMDCKKVLSQWRRRALDMFFTLPPDQDCPLQLYDPLNTLHELHLDIEREGFRNDDGRSSNSFCTECRKSIGQIIRDERELIWTNLSYYFDPDRLA
ncbi:hypothetical protein BD410DRAFT_896201 [Rickenella mellea]|uniref:BTB domain-containing protein n=1 Tax=Rickenella mellea TaxID=50990 RepID=A0A4Y7QD65_9AGAM|nr:hypothetical protein BD410DRAFT_896201 [Rickenella mellea]